MFSLKNLFTRALLALMLVTGAGAALAGPVYHVTVNTAGLEGTGMLDFIFVGYETSPDATATLSNFSGDFGSATYVDGPAVSGDISSAVVLGGIGTYNEFAQAVNLGGLFRFEVSFDFISAGDPVGLAVALFNDDFTAYLGTEGNIAQFELAPGVPDVVEVDGPLVDLVAVPEPANMALLGLGLGLMAWTRRTRRMR